MFSRTFILGRLGKDPEVRYTNNNTAVATLSIASDESFKNNEGEWQKKTEWHRVVVWGARAEAVEQYLSKGSRVFVEGKNQTRKYEQDGETKYTTEVVAVSIQFLDKNDDAEQEERPARPKQKQNSSSSRAANIKRREPVKPKDLEITDDDIPF